MNDIKIGVKLAAAFSLIAVLTAILGIYLYNSLDNVHARGKTLYEQGAVPMSMLVKTAEQAQEMFKLARDWRLSNTDAGRMDAIRKVDAAYSEVRSSLNSQIELAVTEEGRRTLREMLAAADKYVVAFNDYTRTSKNFCPTSGLNLDEFPDTLLASANDLIRLKNEATQLRTRITARLDNENDATASAAAKIAVIGIIAVVLISVSAGMYLTFSITKPLSIVVNVLSKMEKGDMTVHAGLVRGDELGILTKALDSLTLKFRDVMKEMLADSETLASASAQLSAVSSQLASGSEESVVQSTNVAATTGQMAVNINAMASGAEEASVNANEVAGAAEEMSVNMNTISSAVEGMSLSINEIAGNAGAAKKVANEATIKSRDATTVMGKLGTAAKEIGQVTDVIKKIADKTNLLALNATIEAASAGEAGKGFAVVAGEIKELANQSAQSADDIARRIESIQGGTSNAVTAINDISNIIVRISQSVEVIASHADQQTQASNEIANNVAQANLGAQRVANAIGEVAKGGQDIARNAAEAARGATEVSQNVASISQVAKDSAASAAEVSQNAKDLSNIAGNLKSTVSQFKV